MNAAGVLLLVMKVSLLLGAALLAGRALRSAPAERRHRMWSAAFAALVALPPLVMTLPALRVPVPAWSFAAPTPPTPIVPATTTTTTTLGALQATIDPAPALATYPAPRAATAIRLPSARATILLVWLAGAAAALVALLVSLARVHRLAASGTEIDDIAWSEARDRIADRLGLPRRVRILASPLVATPMAGGLVHPAVFVPADALHWTDERRDVVLAHEMAHLANRDPLRHIVSRVAFILYWFHPLAWLAARHAAAACEQACDELVLALGIRPSTYARVLLEFADVAPRHIPSVALPIVRGKLLEARIMAILSGSATPSTRGRAILPAAGAILLTLSVAAARPSATTRAVDPALQVPGTPAPVVATPAAVAARAAAPQRQTPPTQETPRIAPQQTMDCWSDDHDGRSFIGTMSISGRTGEGTIIHEQIGRRGNDRVIEKSFGDFRVCGIAEGLTSDNEDQPSDWPGRASRVVLETRRGDDVRRMELAGGRVTWTISGASRPMDAAAQAWREGLLAVLDATWDLSRLRGQVSTLRGEISTVYGQRSTLQGEISTIDGQVSTLRGQISTVRGSESTLQGEISTIRGQLSTLQGAISTERGAISTLQASRWDAADRDLIADRIKAHEKRIRDVQDEIDHYDADAKIRDVQRRISALDAAGQAAEIERTIRDFDRDGKIAAVSRRLKELDVDGQVSGYEKEIGSLDADRRSRELEARVKAAADRLRDLLGGR